LKDLVAVVSSVGLAYSGYSRSLNTVHGVECVDDDNDDDDE